VIQSFKLGNFLVKCGEAGEIGNGAAK
jgi:hypothetical protein